MKPRSRVIGHRSFPRRIAARAGFTILEIMLAIGIFMIVLTAIYATWMAILKGTRSGLKAAAEVQRSRIAIRTLEDAFLTTEMFMANMNAYLFVADTSGDFAQVSLAARLPASFPGVGRYGDQVVRRVSFYTESGKNNTMDLVMTQAPILANTNAGWQPYTLTLARDVTLFQMEFYDAIKGEWLDEWRFTNQLPKLVRIALGLGKSAKNARDPYDLVSTLVALPSIGVGGDVQGAGPQPGGVPRPGAPGTVPGSAPGSLPGAFPNNPGQGFPNQGFPNQGFPGQGFPGQGFPGQGVGPRPGNQPGGNQPRRF